MSKVEIRIAGGMSDVGAKNGTIIACDGYGLPVDWGQQIPEFGSSEEQREMMDRFGGRLPDEFYPDMSQLDGLRVNALCVTHGHQDHTEGWWKLQERFPRLTLITDPFTGKIIRMRAEKRDKPVAPRRVMHDAIIKAGPFRIRRFAVNHSIPGASGFLVEGGGMRIVHLGDVKPWPSDEWENGVDKNVETFGALSRDGIIDILFLDATNAEEEGCVVSEGTVHSRLETIFRENRGGRIFFSTISSNLRRLESVLSIADRQNRPVYVAGGALRDFLEMAGVGGWIPVYQSAHYKDGERTGRRMLTPPSLDWEEDAIICVTGSQGEPLSFLDAMTERVFSLPPKKYDVMVISQDTIPLEEIEDRFSATMKKSSSRVTKIYLAEDTPEFKSEGAEIIRCSDLHSSGHARQNGLKKTVSITKPRIVVPCHAGRERREILAGFVEEWGSDWGCEALLLDDGDRIKL